MKCICKKCGRVNVFPDGTNPETYGWTWMPDDTMYCFKCEPEEAKNEKLEDDTSKSGGSKEI